MTLIEGQPQQTEKLPRNLWAVSLTSFFMDISSEMVLNILPLFMANVLGVRTSLIGLIEGVAEATASLLKVFSGWLSDRLGSRKWLAVAGYSLSALSRPFFYFANTWGIVAAVRWVDRFGKGVRTAPRDALVADSISARRRGLAFGFHRAADTLGAMLGLLIALAIVASAQAGAVALGADSFRTVVLASLVPAALAVLALAFGAREVRPSGRREIPRFADIRRFQDRAANWARPADVRSLGRPFLLFLLISGLFDLGNSSDAFLVLRAQERGLNVTQILAMLVTFNLIYALVSVPAGRLSDRLGRQALIVGGWLVYAAIYLGFALAQSGWQVWALYVLYGFHYALTLGASKALIADLVPENQRGAAYGTYHAVLGLLDLPASLIAGVLWQGVGGWRGFGAPAPFLFGAATALLAALLMAMRSPAKAPGYPLNG